MRQFLLNHWDTILLLAAIGCVIWLVSLKKPDPKDLVECPRCHHVNHIYVRGNTVYDCAQGQYVIVWCDNCKHCASVQTFDIEGTRLYPPSPVLTF